MTSSAEDRGFRRRMAQVESLIREVEGFPDAKARACTQDLLRAVMELHGAALERVLDKLADAGETGLALIDALAADDLTGCVLLLHGLHPLDLETRVRQALDKVRPFLRSHGGNVELLGLAGGVARLRMLGSCDGCPSSAMTLKLAIEEAIYEQAPDVTAIELDKTATNGHAGENGQARIELPILGQT
jgi:Fe-S cluster biogenesis protein NfuA